MDRQHTGQKDSFLSIIRNVTTNKMIICVLSSKSIIFVEALAHHYAFYPNHSQEKCREKGAKHNDKGVT